MFEIIFDMCRFGTEYKKATKIISNLEVLKGLNMRCRGGHAHVHLVGKKCKLAGEYPRGLVNKWVRLILSDF